MSTLSLLAASILVMIPITISYREKLGLQKEMVVSILRAIIQLVIVGYILNFIFGLEHPTFTIGLVGIMIMNAALNTRKRGGSIRYVTATSFVAILIGTSLTMTVLVLSRAIAFKPNEIIPVAGMIVSNSMVAINLSYRHLNQAFKEQRAEVEAKLSLGAEIKEASLPIIRESVKMAIIPSIDSAKTLGIVSLPGMMTGLILAGTSPLIAIKFQIMVTFMILSAASVAVMIAVYCGYRSFFNERRQLL